MKRLILIPALFCLFMLNVASMCSSDDDSTSGNPAPVINLVKQGTWRITSYIDSGVNETNDYNGYNFTFSDANVLTATNGTNTYTGTWSIVNDSSDDDDSSSDLDFNILFAAPANFADLSDDWDIVTYSANTISLIDVSGGNGGTDTLVFTKN